MSKFISVIINADTRSGFQESESAEGVMFDGCRSVDFLVDGVANKIKFFEGFDKEVILFIDQHENIPEDILNTIRGMVDTLVIRKHDKRYGDMVYCHNFNDFNYLSALFMARGQVIFHADQDTNCFTKDKESVDELIAMLDNYKFISYPSHWSPNAVTDPSFGGRTWASTRFFLCKRETLKFDTLIQCILNPDWADKTFGDRQKKCNWTEHFLAMTNNESVFYPPILLDKLAVFSWGNYKAGTIKKLNESTYDEVRRFISDNNGIVYPNNIYIK
jgi:hypothetical protein